MSHIARRTKYTYWTNEEPITDIHEALYLLSREPTSHIPLYLARGREAVNGGYEIVVHWYNHRGYGSEGVDYYQIDQTLAQRLVDERLVIPRKILHLGYTETREDELVITHEAKEKLKAFEKEMERKAESMLTPGIHTDLTGKPVRASMHRRDHFRYGKVCLEYTLPHGGVVKVYPEEDRLVMPDTK